MVPNIQRRCNPLSLAALALLFAAVVDGIVEQPRGETRPLRPSAHSPLHAGQPIEEAPTQFHEKNSEATGYYSFYFNLFGAHRPGWMRIVGILISITGATLASTGLVLQKLSYMQRDRASKKPTATFFCDGMWMMGFFTFVLGNIVSWLALGMAESSVLSCFNSFNILYAMVVAPSFLNEYVSAKTKRCAGILIVGCVWVAFLGPRSDKLHTLDSVMSLFGQHFFQVIAGLSLIFLVVAKARHTMLRDKSNWAPTDVIQVVSMASIFASYGVLFSKCTSMLVHASVITKENQVHHHFFLFWCCSFLSGVLQVYFLNECLRNGDVSFIIPTYESMSIAVQIIIGGMFFQEYNDFTWDRHLEFWPGIVIVLGGIVLLTRSAEQDKLEGAKAITEGSCPAGPSEA